MVKARDSCQENKRIRKDHHHYENGPCPSENVGSRLCSLQCFGGKKIKKQLVVFFDFLEQRSYIQIAATVI